MGEVARLAVPFTLRGGAGHVDITLATNDDPVALGHALVAPNFDPETFKGFPVVLASIEYGRGGLLALMGWLQVIRHFDAVGAETAFAIDRFPLGPEDSPLYTYGYLPAFFDAPANPDHPDSTWQADTWLVAIPDVIRTRSLVVLAGFRWGYVLRAARPTLLPLTELARSDWQFVLPRLRAEHPRWRFSSYDESTG